MPKQTKEAIVGAFYALIQNKSFEKITVRDIVEECGINRKTFYYYFKDIYDLVEYAFRNEMDVYINNVPEENSLEESISGIFELVEKNKKVVYHLNGSNDYELKKYIYGVLSETIEKKYKTKAAKAGVSERDFKLLCEIFLMAFSGMIATWLNNGMNPEYKDDIKRVCVMLGGSVDTMFDNVKKLSQNQ